LTGRDVGGLGDLNFDIVRAADSLTVMLIVVVVVVIVVVLLSTWVGGRV
jgi:ABC-type methionine transport system permease subunit